MSQIPKSRKPPVIRKNNVITVKHSYTRSELRRAIALDHSYSQPPDQDSINNSSCLTSIDQNESIILKPEVPILQQTFCIETYTNNDDSITFYTSFQTYSHFMICFNFLGDAVNHLIYPGSASNPSTISQTKTQRALSARNEFFMTLCQLRCGLLEQDLAFRFRISQSTVSRILTAWINFLYHKFKEIPIWPSRLQVQSTMPIQFRLQYPNTRIIIDATEVFIQRPSNPNAQQLTFSSYKNHNTAKALAGITPSGAFSFISSLYGGSISDRELLVSSGLLDKLNR